MPHQLAPVLSAEPAGGFDGVRPRRTVVGSATTGINQLLVVTTGGCTTTDDRISLRITDADGFRVVDHTFPTTARGLSRTSTQFVPVRLTFSKAELAGGGITLGNAGLEAWEPESSCPGSNARAHST
jgi:hypothetical protein